MVQIHMNLIVVKSSCSNITKKCYNFKNCLEFCIAGLVEEISKDKGLKYLYLNEGLLW